MKHKPKPEKRLPVIVLMGEVLFPEAILPVMVRREMSLKALRAAGRGDGMMIFLLQKGDDEEPSPDEIYRVGTIGTIVHSVEGEDGGANILIQGVERVKVQNLLFTRGYYSARADMFPFPRADEKVLAPAARVAKDFFAKLVSMIPDLPSELTKTILSQSNETFLYLASAHMPGDPDKKQELLESKDLPELAKRLSEQLLWHIKYLETRQELEGRVKEELARGHKQVILSQLQDEIKKEMEEEDDFSVYEKRILGIGMPDEAREKALSELKRLTKTPAMSPEASVIRTWLDWITEMPWNSRTEDNLDLENARRTLDEDHYGLTEVKERILEYLAVLQLKGATRGQVLCFVGPPGVGKTSLARSIARALGRKFVRASLGGLRDEAEIRGHRRTYVGALPGKIIQQVKRAGTKNPVFLLDEVDKVGTDYRGDPQAALMEVLDPEINAEFMDHYLELPFDLSEVLFITTANSTAGIPKPLLDRMDVIYLRGYTDFEKTEIAKRHLVPKLLEEHGLEPDDFTISPDVILKIIREYTSEAGVRELERQIARLMRKSARRKVEKSKPTSITLSNLEKFLDLPAFQEHRVKEENPPGVFYGLAWTEQGGDALRVETTVSRGKGNLITTGQLGEIINESIKAALSYIKAHRVELGLPPNFHELLDIHIHIPEGAIPKDGPSAGLAVLASMVSALTKQPVPGTNAATGEITLTGQVLRVGGLVAKLMAAQRSGIKTVYLPLANAEEVAYTNKKMEGRLLSGLTVKYVSACDEFLSEVFPSKKRRPIASASDYLDWLRL
ncbi:MAG: endopeptidase La [candidate division WOR-3 bacterium]